MKTRHCVVWVQYDVGGPWTAIERPARYGRQEPPLTEQQACREAQQFRELGTRAQALPVGVDPNAAKKEWSEVG